MQIGKQTSSRRSAGGASVRQVGNTEWGREKQSNERPGAESREGAAGRTRTQPGLAGREPQPGGRAVSWKRGKQQDGQWAEGGTKARTKQGRSGVHGGVAATGGNRGNSRRCRSESCSGNDNFGAARRGALEAHSTATCARRMRPRRRRTESYRIRQEPAAQMPPISISKISTSAAENLNLPAKINPVRKDRRNQKIQTRDSMPHMVGTFYLICARGLGMFQHPKPF
ncbi:hypothetical protein B0H13DRAFT_1918144 [Mycena leptocephala]|nr:hypothetical protein B0H13DRAFT_1918144 [Mycena leptocephala]